MYRSIRAMFFTKLLIVSILYDRFFTLELTKLCDYVKNYLNEFLCQLYRILVNKLMFYMGINGIEHLFY